MIQLPVEDQEEYRRLENHKPTGPNQQQQNTDSFCSSAHEIFSRIRLGHNKVNFNKCKRTEITQVQSTFSNHSGVKLEINNGRKFGKFTNVEIKQHTPK